MIRFELGLTFCARFRAGYLFNIIHQKGHVLEMEIREGRQEKACGLMTVGGFKHEVELPYTSMDACSNTSTAVAETQCISLMSTKRTGRA